MFCEIRGFNPRSRRSVEGTNPEDALAAASGPPNPGAWPVQGHGSRWPKDFAQKFRNWTWIFFS
jgi:hypothetical protein